jgi:hypothetical protein
MENGARRFAPRFSFAIQVKLSSGASSTCASEMLCPSRKRIKREKRSESDINKRGAAVIRCAREGTQFYRLVTVVIAIVPIVIGVPAAAILIPPTMAFAPAAFPGLMQFMTPVVGLPAVPPVALGRFVKFIVGPGDASLAIVIIGQRAGSARESEQTSQDGCG